MKRPPDVEIGASASARRVRFKEKPQADVRFRGEGIERSRRENLPDEVEPGVTYRDVHVGWTAEGRLEKRSQPRKES